MTIREELIKATAMKQGNQEDQVFLTKLVRAVSNLGDAEWEALTEPAQDWFDSAADAIEKKTAIPAFPDEGKPSRRRAVAEDAPAAEEKAAAKPAAEEKTAPDYQLSVGDIVALSTKRGGEFEGEVMEFDDTNVVIKVDGDEETLRRSSVTSIRLVSARAEVKKGGGKPKPAAKVEEPAEEPEDKADEPVAEEKPKTRTRAAPPAEAKEEVKAEPVKKSGSVTQKMRVIICENPDASKEELDKLCQKAGLEYRKSTMDIMYSDTIATIRCLRDLGKL